MAHESDARQSPDRLVAAELPRSSHHRVPKHSGRILSPRTPRNRMPPASVSWTDNPENRPGNFHLPRKECCMRIDRPRPSRQSTSNQDNDFPMQISSTSGRSKRENPRYCKHRCRIASDILHRLELHCFHQERPDDPLEAGYPKHFPNHQALPDLLPRRSGRRSVRQDARKSSNSRASTMLRSDINRLANSGRKSTIDYAVRSPGHLQPSLRRLSRA